MRSSAAGVCTRRREKDALHSHHPWYPSTDHHVVSIDDGTDTTSTASSHSEERSSVLNCRVRPSVDAELRASVSYKQEQGKCGVIACVQPPGSVNKQESLFVVEEGE